MGSRAFRIIAAALALAGPAARAATPEPVDGTESGIRLDTVTDRADRMTVPVKVNGEGPFGFVVDTGANSTVVSDRLAASLALPAQASRTMQAATGSIEVQMARIGSLEVGGLARQGVGAAVIGQNGIGAPGMLGIDSLAGKRVVMNFRTNAISVADARARPTVEARDPAGTIVVSARRRGGQLILTEATYRGVPIDVVIDTGAEYSIGNSALLRLVLAREVVPVGSEVMSVTGQTAPVDVAAIPELSVGGLRIANLPTAFADLACFRRFGLARRPALLLGMNALRLFERVAIDFGRRQVSFFRDDLYSRPVCPIGSRLCRPI